MSGAIAADEYFPYVFFGPIQATRIDIESDVNTDPTHRGINFIDTFATKTGLVSDVKEQLLGSYQSGGGGIIQAFVTSLMRMIAGADGAGGGSAFLEVESYSGGVSPGGYTGARAVVGGVDRLIADASGKSAFPSWGPGNKSSNLQMQIGSVGITATVVGQQATAFALPTPWPTQHLLTIPIITNVNTSWPTILACLPQTLSACNLVYNSPTAQAFTLGFISFGH